MNRVKAAAMAGALALVSVHPALAQSEAPAATLRVVMHSDLKIIDPIWTTAYISRDHGYMVYDTLLALDADGNVQPQMVASWEVSDEGLTYTFTLRDRLSFHDGAPVTSEDVIASLERWGARDTMGQLLLNAVDEMRAVDAQTFTLSLGEPYGLVEQSLAKPSSNVPFIMPARIAATPPDEQIEDPTGSGPYVFDRDAWEPGNKVVYRRFADYVPRAEPASWLAGGKTATFDVVEWQSMPDPQTAINALVTGEVDMVEQVAHDLLPLVDGEADIEVAITNPLGLQYMFRFNHLHPPFDDATVRQAAIAALNQQDLIQATIGNPDYYAECAAMFVCGSPFATDVGGDVALASDFDAARALLAEAAYDDTPVTLMHATDIPVLANLAPVAKSLLERGGFTVDMQSMDWQTLVSRRANKATPADGGWNAFLTAWTAADVMNPISAAGFNASGDEAWYGWPNDAELEALRAEFARTTDIAAQKALAEAIQLRALAVGTHMHAGQYFVPAAYRTDRIDGAFVQGPATVFWRVAPIEG